MNKTRIYRLRLRPEKAQIAAQALDESARIAVGVAKQTLQPRDPARKRMVNEARACREVARGLRQHRTRRR